MGLYQEGFANLIMLSQLTTVSAKCTACDHDTEKSTSLSVLLTLGACMLE
jgi:hypothetical protein